MIISEVLNRLLAEGRITAEEAARVCECSVSLIYRARNDESELGMTRIARLSRHLCAVYGDTSLAACFAGTTHAVVPRGPATANGSLDDEAAALFAAFGAAITAFQAGDRYAVSEAITRAERALQDARAERDRL